MRESEYWSNDAENSALHQINQLKYTEVGHSNCNNIIVFFNLFVRTLKQP